MNDKFRDLINPADRPGPDPAELRARCREWHRQRIEWFKTNGPTAKAVSDNIFRQLLADNGMDPRLWIEWFRGCPRVFVDVELQAILACSGMGPIEWQTGGPR